MLSISLRKMRALLSVLLAVQQVYATGTCFLQETTTTPYIAMSATVEESLQWCYTICDEAPGCTSVVWDDTDRSCVKLTNNIATGPNMCHAPYVRYYKSDSGCPYPNPMATMVSDPCSRLMPFLLTYESNKVCPQRKCDGSEGPPIVVRYIDESGNLRTLDNALNNILSFDTEKMLWGIFYKDTYGYSTTYATGLACAEMINPSACPCDPLPEYGEPNLCPKGPLLVEQTPACPPEYPNVINKNVKTGTRTLHDPSTFKATCIGGVWMACVNNSDNYSAMLNGGCGTDKGKCTKTTTVPPG